MDWISSVNEALGYIDRKLDGDIDYDEICRITASPMQIFQRFFMLAAGIPLSEYIRRRRLTRAAWELQNTDLKVIDIALKYGYESSDAFSVAFKRLFGIPPAAARPPEVRLKKYYRVYFNLSVSYVKDETETILQNVDHYRVTEPLFEGFRVIMNYLGESYTPEYIQGVSGAGFFIAGGCPSRPTCLYDMQLTDFIRYMGYEFTEYPCFDGAGNKMTEALAAAVKRSVDEGRPVLCWHAFSSMEWDVVCGYDGEQKQFVGRSSYSGRGEYARASWNRPAGSEAPFGAIVLGEKKRAFDARRAEIASLRAAVRHARRTAAPDAPSLSLQGVQFYKRWAEEYAREGKYRDTADAYCHQIYSSARRAAAGYLREIAPKYEKTAAEALSEAAGFFERECECLGDAYPHLSWNSPWGVNEERSGQVAPILAQAAVYYERAVECIEKALAYLEAPAAAG